MAYFLLNNMYHLYILKCADGTLYTGITTDLDRRLVEHNNNKLGAKYTSARRPVELLASWKFKNRSLASKEEARIKKLSRTEKLELMKVMPKNNLENLRKEILKLKNPAKAKILMRFFKTGKGEYGEGDKFLGIVMPKLRGLVKEYWKDLKITEIEKLLKSGFHEERMIALLLLVKKFETGEEQDPSTGSISSGQGKIFKLYLKNMKFINNWDLVDLTAPNIVGEYLKDKDRKVLYKLAKSKNLWEKRISILATFQFIKNKDPKDTLKISEMLLQDDQDLIHKAVGWMLREVGKKCGEGIEEKFLQKHVKKMPRTMLRYAIERFPEKKRQFYLKK